MLLWQSETKGSIVSLLILWKAYPMAVSLGATGSTSICNHHRLKGWEDSRHVVI